jgi:hypothetical protein
MARPSPEVEAVVRDLAEILGRGLPPDEPSAQRARDAVRAAAGAGSGRAAREALARAHDALDDAREALAALRPDGDEHPAPRALRMGRAELFIDSEIPDQHPGKRAIETAVAGAFAGVVGRWRVAIIVQDKASWWGLRVEGGSVCWTGTLDGPEEQSADFVGGRVREAVQLGLMQSALGRSRPRG